MNKSNVRRNIFLGTLGASYAVIPEVFGFIAPGALPLFSNHPKAADLEAIRVQHALHEPDEVWLITTGGSQTAKSIASVEAWWQLIGEPKPLRIWIAEGTDQLATQDECALLREMTFRAVLAATEQANGGQLILSLAGGRKTMSADLQLAGSLFGAAAWLHVVGPEPMPAELARDPDPEIFARPLRADLAAAVTPRPHSAAPSRRSSSCTTARPRSSASPWPHLRTASRLLSTRTDRLHRSAACMPRHRHRRRTPRTAPAHSRSA